MTRARCSHCEGVFTVGEKRACCLPGAVAEQERLRARLIRLEGEKSRAKVQEFIDGLASQRKSFL